MSDSEARRLNIIKWRSLRGKSEFSKVYGSGYKRVGRLLVLYMLPAAEHAKGVVASRKVGGAVQRNRAKRLLREALNRCSLGESESFAAALAAAKSVTRHGVSTTQKRDGEEAASEDPQREETAPLEALWLVAIARPAILAARTQDVLAEIEQLLAP